MMRSMLVAKAALLAGITLWMSVAVLNNVTDPGTNRFHLGAMFDMSLLRSDPNLLGSNLLWRAIPSDLAAPLLWMIAVVQTAICLYLWKATVSFSMAILHFDKEKLRLARVTAVRALTSFMCLWLVFMIGGFWFGYWIKQGAIQQVHMTLLILSVIAIGFVGNGREEEVDTFENR